MSDEIKYFLISWLVIRPHVARCVHIKRVGMGTETEEVHAWLGETGKERGPKTENI